METAFGDPAAAPAADDVVAYLSWVQSERVRRRAALPLHSAKPAAR